MVRGKFAVAPELTVADVEPPLTGCIPKGAAPVPVKLTICGPPTALSVSVSVAVRTPVAGGVKFTVMEQLAAGAADAH